MLLEEQVEATSDSKHALRRHTHDPHVGRGVWVGFRRLGPTDAIPTVSVPSLAK